jgi:transposase
VNASETLELPETLAQTSSCYNCAPYKQVFYYGQEMRRKYQASEDRVDHWKKKAQDLLAENAYLKKLLFGRKSEKDVSDKSKNRDPVPEDPIPKTHGAQKGHQGFGRNIPTHLPTEERHYSLLSQEAVCDSCGLPFEQMNTEEISYEVTVEILYRLIKHIRKKYRKTCQCPHPIVTAPGPVKLFEKGLYSMDFWIQVLVDKYVYGLPLERQLGKMNTHGLQIASGALADGLLRLVPMLKPLYELMLQRIAFEKLVHGDETRWYNWACCYDPDRSDEKARGYLWGLFSELYHVFIIDPSRGANVLKNKLGQGKTKTILPTFVCDRYSGYKALHTLLAFCWAHVRRDFLGLKTKYPDDEDLCAWADRWICLIRDLYAVNHLRLRHRDDPPRFEAHQKQLQGVLNGMQTLMDSSSTKKPQIKQVKSMREHWSGLTLFVKDPGIPLDNNLAERALRTPVVGRKNFYGNHSDRATEATAVFYSILSTCKLHNVHTHKFLKRYLNSYVQTRGSPMPTELLERFLPHNYAKQYPQDLLSG